MVDGSNYVSNTEGAPPLPPVGGYHGASRAAQVSQQLRTAHTAQVSTATLERPRHPNHWLGWTALGAAILFALTLGVLLFASTSEAIFSLTMFVVQLIVVALVVAALVTKRARRLGIAALTVALLVNVATMGSIGAVQMASTGNYDTNTSPAEQYSQGFPGVDGYSKDEILAQPTIEQERRNIAAVFTAVRDELSSVYGVTWTQTGAEDRRHMRNGRGGESMLYTVTFDSWTTNEPIHDLELKEAMLHTAADVFSGFGFYAPLHLNENDGTIPESQMRNLYGGVYPSEQVLWSRVTWEDWNTPSAVYFEITDLSRDTTGDFRRAAEARRANPNDPIEGFSLAALSEPLLSENDIEEFTERMQAY